MTRWMALGALLTTLAGAPQPPALPPDALLLQGVPRVGYDVHLCPFPGCLYACLKYLGDEPDYDTLMGVSGAAFRRTWNRDDGGNVDLMYFQPEPHTRILDALGYEYRTTPNSDKPAMVAAIKESIAKGRPVLMFGPVGPPECALITGYSRDGEALHGWSYFQEGDKGKYFEATGWFEKMDRGCPIGVIVLGEKKAARPLERQTLIRTLEWAIDLARTAQRKGIPDHVCGLAAYDAWAAGLEVDADFPADDPKVLATRVMVHGDQCAMLHERNQAAGYLRAMAKVAPEAAKPLNAAADLYNLAAGVGEKVWPFKGDPKAGLANAATRREIARHVRFAREKEAAAVEQLEKALAVLRGAAE